MANILHRQMTFGNTFSWKKIFIFVFEFHGRLFPWIQLIYVSIGTGNGKAPNREQAITGTDDNPVSSLIHLCPDELLYEAILVILCFYVVQQVITLWSNNAIWHHRAWSTLVQVMTCRLYGTKPSPEPMLTYCQLDIQLHISMKYWKFIQFRSTKCIVCKMLAILSSTILSSPEYVKLLANLLPVYMSCQPSGGSWG